MAGIRQGGDYCIMRGDIRMPSSATNTLGAANLIRRLTINSLLPDAKACTKCHETKPLSEFHRSKATADGRCYTCKDCARAKSRQWQANNKERAKAYRESRKEHYARLKREWDDANREYVRQRSREWYAANKEYAAECDREYKAANRERYTAYQHNRDARLKVAGTHTGEEIQKMYEDQQGLCAYCEMPLFGTYQVDHMLPVSRGGANDWTNLAVTCEQCNWQKKAKTPEEFIDWRSNAH